MVVAARKAAPGPKGKKKAQTFVIDCSKPVDDKIMDIASFEQFLLEKIKVEGKAGGPRLHLHLDLHCQWSIAPSMLCARPRHAPMQLRVLRQFIWKPVGHCLSHQAARSAALLARSAVRIVPAQRPERHRRTGANSCAGRTSCFENSTQALSLPFPRAEVIPQPRINASLSGQSDMCPDRQRQGPGATAG